MVPVSQSIFSGINLAFQCIVTISVRSVNLQESFTIQKTMGIESAKESLLAGRYGFCQSRPQSNLGAQSRLDKAQFLDSQASLAPIPVSP